MKRNLLVTLVGMLALSAYPADPKDEVNSAARRLGDKPNYSWTATPRFEGGSASFRQGPTEGKTEKGGYTFYTVTFGDSPIEAAFKGTKSALKRQDTWESAEDLEGDNPFIARRLRTFKPAAGEAEDLAAKAKELKAGADGLYSGDLTEDGVKELFTRGGRSGQNGFQVSDAKGWVKFWVKDGLLTKYEFNVQAKLTVGQDQRALDVNRTTTVEIKDVGSTKVTVPDEARKKLS